MTIRSFVAAIASFSLGPIVSALLSFALVPIITRLVDPSLMGQLSMYTTAVALASLISLLGMDQAFARDFFSEDDRRSLIVSSSSIPFLVSLIMAVAVLWYRESLATLLFGQPAPVATLLLAAAIPLSVALRYVALSVRMTGAGVRYSLVQISQKAVTLVSTLVLVTTVGASLWPLIAAPVLALLLSALLGLFLVPRGTFVQGSGEPGRFSRSIAVSQLSFGLPLVVASTQHWTLNFLDKIALRTWASFDDLGLYTAAFRLGSVLLLFHQTFTAFWTPTAYRWHEDGVDSEAFQQVTDGVAVFLLFVYGLLIVSRRLLILLLGPAYRDAVTLIPALALVPLLMALSETTVVGIAFSRRTVWATGAMTGAAAFNILGNWLLVPQYGATGAAIATAGAFWILFWLRTGFAIRLWRRIRLNILIPVSGLLLVMMFGSIAAGAVLYDVAIGVPPMIVAAVVGYKLYRGSPLSGELEPDHE